jgi:hypothetical protein
MSHSLTPKPPYLDDIYSDHQLHLLILGTHPDYQRHGAGTRHCRWGIELATKQKLALTTFRSPMGIRLYTQLELKKLGEVIVQVDGEERNTRLAL